MFSLLAFSKHIAYHDFMSPVMFLISDFFPSILILYLKYLKIFVYDLVQLIFKRYGTIPEDFW